MPNGWYFGDYGYHYYLPDVKSGIQTYIDKVQQYGIPAPGSSTLEYTGFAGPTFANLLTLVKFVNTIGYANVTTPTLLTQIKGFKGPMMLQVGPIDCGHVGGRRPEVVRRGLRDPDGPPPLQQPQVERDRRRPERRRDRRGQGQGVIGRS